MSLQRIVQNWTLLSRNHQCNRHFVRWRKRTIAPEVMEKHLDPEVNPSLCSKMNLVSQQEGDHIFITKYSGLGFSLHNSIRLAGPTVFFPRNCLKWKVFDLSDINEKSLGLFSLLTPKLDLLTIGTGIKKQELPKETVTFLRKHQIMFEVLSTISAADREACEKVLTEREQETAFVGRKVTPMDQDTVEEKVTTALRVLSVEEKMEHVRRYVADTAMFPLRRCQSDCGPRRFINTADMLQERYFGALIDESPVESDFEDARSNSEEEEEEEGFKMLRNRRVTVKKEIKSTPYDMEVDLQEPNLELFYADDWLKIENLFNGTVSRSSQEWEIHSV